MGRLSEKTLHGIAWGFMLAYFAPYLFLGQDLSITIHDNLDSNLVWMKLILEHSTFWSPPETTIEPIMGGMPLYTLSPVYDLPYLIFSGLGIFNGYIFLRFLMMVVAFYGMRAFLRTHISEFNANASIDGFRAESRLVETRSSSGVETIVYGISLCFAILPFWGFNFSVPTLPLLFWALLNIHKGKQTKWDYLAILFVGLTASLVLTTIFVVVGFGLYGLLQWYTHRIKPFKLYGALIFLTVIQIATYWKIFWGTLDPPMGTSHRTEFNLLYLWPGRIFSRAFDLLIEGWYHSPSEHYLFLSIIPIAMVLFWKQRRSQSFLLASEFILLSCLFYGAVNFDGFKPMTSLITRIIPIQLQRVHFIQPLAWYVLFALSLFYIAKMLPWARKAIPLIIGLQIMQLFGVHEYFTQSDMPSYKSFYAEELFDEVKTYLGPEESGQYCIFISSHPAILHYNGFNTLDGYLANYPLEYKYAFGEIIAGELAKNDTLKHNYDIWGSRAYSMVGSIGKNWIHPKSNIAPSLQGQGTNNVTSSDSVKAESYRDVNLQNLDYNWQAFKDLGGKYIFSPFPIHDPNINYLKTFDHPGSAWTIYLYGLKDSMEF